MLRQWQIIIGSGQMSEVKSSLVLGQSNKKEAPLVNEVEYKQINNKDDFIGELSDQQKEIEFNRQHEEYIKMKLNRKKELIRIKREEFGTSSSEENQNSSDDEIEKIKQPKKVQAKRSKGKVEGKSSLHQDSSTYPILLELKKLSVETDLVLLDKEFQVNKRTIPYAKVIRIHLYATEDKPKRKLRIILMDEEFAFAYKQREDLNLKDKSEEIFLKFLKAKLESKETKFFPLSRKSNPNEYSSEHIQGAVAYDRIFKKSQIIGTWQQRFIIIKEDGLYSYRSLKSKPTMYISLKEMREVQTQFDLYKDLLVVKLIYNTTKTDFGLPMDPQLQWIGHFLSLIPS